MSCLYLAVFFCVSVQVGVSFTPLKRIRVPENYRGPWPWYLTKIEMAADLWQKASLVGNEDGMFELDPVTGFLCALKPFDREEKANYTITVIGGNQTMTVNIDVMDENDHTPVLDKSTLHGIVCRGTQAGVSFLHVVATDGDDPTTENADLRYRIIQSDESWFHIEPRTGAVSLTEQGVTYLSRSDVSHFRLVVQVKDLGDRPSGFVASSNLEIVVAENIWSSPSSVSIPENLRGDYPFLISEVLWNSTEVRYELSGSFVGDLFTIDKSGNIYVTEELDWERQSEYQIMVSALNDEGVLYSEPLHITVIVTDENDNAPVFNQNTYVVEITEATRKGSLLLELKAEDADDPSTRNAKIEYNIQSQEPQLPRDGLFHIGKRSGQLTLLDDSLKPNRYTLIVSATNWAEELGGLRGSCTVIINVKDVNDNPPVFIHNQFLTFIIAEDAAPGTTIVTLTAIDDDVETVNKAMEFSIASGNEDGTFRIKPDGDENAVTVFLEKDLDYERVQEYRLVVAVKNVVELLGVEYGPNSTASIIISLSNVNEAPVFTEEKYEVQVPENTLPGALILNVSASDPDIHHQAGLRYSIRGDSRNLLSIQEVSGKIQLRQLMDREQYGDTYRVSVLAQEAGDGGLSASAEVVIHILDVNDNIPTLIGDYRSEYFCTPKREEQRTIITAFDGDSPENSIPFTFSLPKNAELRSQWMLTAINGTHAYLSMRSHHLDSKVHKVPIIIADSGAKPQSRHVSITVLVCHCNNRAVCKVDVDKMPGMPTLSSALGILLGTLGAIGIILIIIFSHLALSAPRRKAGTTDDIPLKNTI
ncbi:cadherin-16 isoform X1 [Aquarana catesbeiana]|uniref:cadherin-16 isoform X1 n=1 Tax=Aquarana catesbeiana TaxID=8400 RepID=UPI003CC9CE14